MTTRHWTFNDLLAALKYNVGQSTMPEIAGITQIRKEVAGIILTATLTRSNVGPDYFTYPVWNTTDLQNWWTLASFETKTGAGGVRDIIGSQDGTINGDPTLAQAFDDIAIGRKRHYTSFDGTGDFINLGDITALDGATQMSWGARIRLGSASSVNTIVSRWPSADGDKQFIFRTMANGNIQVFFATDSVGGVANGEAVLLASQKLTTETWYDILFTYLGGGAANSDRLKIYRNGIAQIINFTGTIPASLQAVTDDVMVGRQEDDTTLDFKGDLYDVVYWDDDLTSGEITAWATDAVSDRIIAELFRLPGTLVTDIMPTKHSYIPVIPKRRGYLNGYKHQITNQV